MNIDDENTPYKKRSKKTVPKKADHKHDYEPVIIECWNPELKYERNKGFIGGTDLHPGSRCKVCGKLALNFPRGSLEYSSFMEHYGIPFIRREVLKESEFSHLDVCNVKNIWDL